MAMTGIDGPVTDDGTYTPKTTGVIDRPVASWKVLMTPEMLISTVASFVVAGSPVRETITSDSLSPQLCTDSTPSAAHRMTAARWIRDRDGGCQGNLRARGSAA